MKPDNSHPALLQPPSNVLLILFMPLNLATDQQQTSLTQLVDSVQKRFGNQLRVLRIDPVSYPHVVHSFAVTQTPTFLLVRQGVELWRQEGLPDEDTLVSLIQPLLTP